MTDKESDMFEIRKGTKQGDPPSSLLFNTVLQEALKDDISTLRKELEIDNIKVVIFTGEKKHRISWTNGYIPATRDDRDQESDQGCLGDVLQIQTRADLKIVPSSTSASLFRHGGHPNDELRLRNMDTLKRTRRDDSIDAAQNAPPHHTNKKKIQEKDTGQKWKKVKEEVGKPEKVKDGKEVQENHGSSDDETDDGNSSNTDCDQDTDISFMNDTDEEIDIAEIEEEDWIEYMKRGTDE